MPQNKEMKRLIKDGKIVGYERHIPEDSKAKQIKIQHSVDGIIWLDVSNPFDWSENSMIYTSFELGTEIDDEWWFDGDIGSNHWFGKFTLVYDDGDLCWGLIGGETSPGFTGSLKQFLSESKKMGSTHKETSP